jgi:serine/threonine protein kinase
VAPIGAGGMGEVYKARDTRLNRDVPIKVCAAAEFSERFQREAQAAASVNYPNICQLYDVGPHFLGAGVGQKSVRPLSVDTALNYARQMAEFPCLRASGDWERGLRDCRAGDVSDAQHVL